jgi:polysaccharide deacetylase family protein (PEP-CTERM system associated)
MTALAPTLSAERGGGGAPLSGRPSGLVNAMTVDVEDYFQVQAFAGAIARDAWETLPRRVERNTDRLLDLFAAAGVKATFFTLGWVAERHPRVIRRIVAEGHELASHGYAHCRADDQTAAEFRADVVKTKSILEDCGGTAVRGYRAATFSIGPRTPWAFEILAEAGYRYSSSINPIVHDLYGVPDGPRAPYRDAGSGLVEIPLTTVRLWGHNFPCAGGGYFRLFPYALSLGALRHVNRADRMPCVFYLHPWEIDPDQPRQHQAPWKSRFRHYLNLARTETRLKRLLADLAWGRMDEAFAPALAGDAT